jgi:DNA-binding response OmpR family regulator
LRPDKRMRDKAMEKKDDQPGRIMSGKLKAGTLQSLLKAVKQTRQTGKLLIKARDGFGIITLNKGAIISATTPLLKKKVSEEILKRGIITEEELRIVAEKQKNNPHYRLEKLLIDEGCLSKNTLFEILKGLSEEALFGMLFWEGIYRFKEGGGPDESAVPMVDIEDFISKVDSSIDELDGELDNVFAGLSSDSPGDNEKDINETLAKVAKSLTTFKPREIVIVVEDELLIRRIVADGLVAFGFDVEAYGNVKDALKRIQEIDMERVSPVIILDLVMTGLYDDKNVHGGMDLLEYICRHFPSIPVVITTGSDDPELKIETSFFGASYFISKPKTATQGTDNTDHPLTQFIEEIAFNIENIYGKRQAFLEKEQLASVREELLSQLIRKGSVSFKDESDIVKAQILFVDDEPGICRLGEEFLRADGFTHIDIVKDGQEAIRLFTEKKHDVVITDIVMPKRNGIEVLGFVKILSPHSQVIIITGNADKDAAVAALKLGAYHFIEKPIDFGGLMKIIRNAIELKMLFDQKA